MALNKTALKNGIEALHAELFANAGNLTTAQAGTRYATEMADLIDAFVKSGDGKYQAGTLTAGATAVTAVGGTPTVIKIS